MKHLKTILLLASLSLAVLFTGCEKLESSQELIKNIDKLNMEDLKDKAGRLLGREPELPDYSMEELKVAAEGYYYQRLPEDMQQVYKAVLAGFLKQEDQILLPSSRISFDQVEMYRDYIFMDHPELFWFGGECRTIEQGKEFTIEPVWLFSPNEVAAYKKQLHEATKEAKAAIRSLLEDPDFARESDLRDYRIARAVFEYTIDHVTYNMDSPYNQTLVSSMVLEESVCEGIARMSQYLLQKFGLECVLVEGDHLSTGEPHAWLIVKIGDEYYQMDPTFGDASFNKSDDDEIEEGSFTHPELRFNYSDFLMNDLIAERSHKARNIGEISLPECDSDHSLYFKLTNAYFPEETEKEDWMTHFHKTMANGSQFWEVQFEDYLDFQECVEAASDESFDDDLYYMMDLSPYSRECYSYDEENYVIAWWLE